MKKIAFIIVLIFVVCVCRSQKAYTDSLLNIIQSSKNVQTRVEAARYYIMQKPVDSFTYCGNKLIKIGTEKKYDDMTAMGKVFIAFAHSTVGQTYKALGFNIEALKLAEKVQNDFLFAFVYNNYGNIYSSFNTEKSIEYYKKSLYYLKDNNSRFINFFKRSALNNLGSRFNSRKQYDSAFVYLKQSEELSVLLNDASQSTGGVYLALGNTYLGLNQTALAYAYFKLGVENAIMNEDRNKRNAYIQLARYYKFVGHSDSALNCLNIANAGLNMDSLPGNWVTESSIMLYEIYKERGNEKEALKYLEMTRTAKLKFDSAAQLQQLQALSFEEDQRQMAVASEKVKLVDERNHNLQYAAIAIALITFIILFLILSRSIVVKTKFIEFFGVLGLLAVFEFINLFIHPYLARVTKESPILMLIVLIGVGALLIPLHHKLEKWITGRMIEKNKKIRLEAAEKTIRSLTGPTPEADIK